jgi:hypothetical protein
LPWPLNKIVRWVTRQIITFVEVFDFSSADASEGGTGLNAEDTINLNGKIANLGSQNRLLIINEDGSIDPASNVNAELRDFDGDGDDEYVVDDIINDGVAKMSFIVPRGDIIGNAILEVGRVIPKVEIINKSELDLVIQQIDMISDNAGNPDVTFISENDGEYLFPEDVSAGNIVSSLLDIGNRGAGDIIFSKSISNPTANFFIVNDGGDIGVTSSDVVIEAGDAGSMATGGPGGIFMSAQAGSIGSAEQRFNASLVRGKLLPDGSVANTPAILDASASGDLYLDVFGVNYAFDVFDASAVADGIHLVLNSDTGDINVVAEQGVVFFDEEQTVVIQVQATDSDGNPLFNEDGSPLLVDEETTEIIQVPSVANAIYDLIGVTASSGDFLMTAVGDVRVGSIAAAGVAALSATRSIEDAQNDDVSDIDASDIVLGAVMGIGSELNALDINSSNTAPGSLVAAGGDNIYITEVAGDLTLDLVTSTSGTVVLEALSGAILDGDVTSAPDVVASAAILKASSGIGEPLNSLDTVLSNVEADAGTGGIWIDNTGALTVDGAFATGPIVITTFSPLTVAADVISLSSIHLQATDSIGPGDDLIIQSGVTVHGLGTVTLLAGDNLIVEAGSIIQAGTDLMPEEIIIRLDQIPGDIGGSIQIFGTLIGSLTQIFGDEGDNVIAITNVAAETPMIVLTFGGDDTINVGSNATLVSNTGGTVESIADLLTIDAGDGLMDSVNVDDTGDALANTGVLTDDTLTGLGMAEGINYLNVEALSIALGSGGDTFTVESTHLDTTTLDTGAGGDTVNLRTNDGETEVNTGAGSDTVNLGSLAPVSGGVLDEFNALITLEGEGDDDVLNVDDSGDSENNDGTLTGTTITGLGTSGIVYGTFETLNIGLGTGHDRFNVRGTSPETNIDAGWGDDLIYVSSGANLAAMDGLATNGDLEALHDVILHGDATDPLTGAPVSGGTLDFILGLLASTSTAARAKTHSRSIVSNKPV